MALRPYNLLLITPHQLRSDFLSCYGHPKINSWYIDRLAREGVRFENCYCASPSSGPSQISFVTSTYVGEHNYRHPEATISPHVPNLVVELNWRVELAC